VKDDELIYEAYLLQEMGTNEYLKELSSRGFERDDSKIEHDSGWIAVTRSREVPNISHLGPVAIDVYHGYMDGIETNDIDLKDMITVLLTAGKDQISGNPAMLGMFLGAPLRKYIEDRIGNAADQQQEILSIIDEIDGGSFPLVDILNDRQGGPQPGEVDPADWWKS
jgi:hypothetical protein